MQNIEVDRLELLSFQEEKVHSAFGRWTFAMTFVFLGLLFVCEIVIDRNLSFSAFVCEILTENSYQRTEGIFSLLEVWIYPLHL